MLAELDQKIALHGGQLDAIAIAAGRGGRRVAFLALEGRIEPEHRNRQLHLGRGRISVVDAGRHRTAERAAGAIHDWQPSATCSVIPSSSVTSRDETP